MGKGLWFDVGLERACGFVVMELGRRRIAWCVVSFDCCFVRCKTSRT